MAAIRRAEVVWEGTLARGSGTVTAASSQAFSNLPVTWASRTERSDGKTSPEELIAAAHASCFAMAFSFGLGNAGSPPERLSVSAEVTFDQVDGGWKVVSSALTVRGRVPGMDDAAFKQAAEGAKDGCPISQALKGNVALSVDAALES
ncbi:MAG: OsmC family peroxiredoxin [Chloroflexota bacterium]